METVTVSSKFQAVIPLRVRREQRIRPGDKLAIVVKHGLVHLVPVRPFESSRATFKGANPAARGVREHSNRV